jgi:hypothetical protein
MRCQLSSPRRQQQQQQRPTAPQQPMDLPLWRQRTLQRQVGVLCRLGGGGVLRVDTPTAEGHPHTLSSGEL